jgi:hypothetical protein
MRASSPADAGLIRSLNFLTQNLNSLTVINTTTPDSPYLPPDLRPPTSRVLNELSVTAPDGSWGDYPDSAYVQAVCTEKLSRGEDIFLYSFCADGPSVDDYDRLRASQNASVFALKDLFSRMNESQQARARVLEDLHNAQVVQQNWTNMTDARLVALDRELKLIKQAEEDLYAELVSKFAKQKTTIVQTATDLSSLALEMAAFINSTSSNIQQLTLLETQIMTQALNNIAAFFSVYIDDQVQISKLHRSFELDMLDLFTSLERYASQDDLLIAQTAQTHAALQKARTTPNARGALLQPFTDDPGQAPANDLSNLGPLLNHLSTSDVVIREVVDYSGTIYGVTTRLQSSCGSVFVMRKGPSGPGWRDTLEWFGPSGCDTTWALPNDPKNPQFCKCAIVVSEQRCVMQNTSASTLLAYYGGRTETTTATGCVATGVPFLDTGLPTGGLDQFTVTSHTDLARVFARIGQRTPYAGGNSKPYRYLSLARSVGAYVPFKSEMSNATNFMALAAPDKAVDTQNLIWYYLQSLPLDYAVAYQSLDAYSSAVNGLLPGGMQQRPILYRKFEGIKVGRGWELSLALFSTEFLVVSRMVQQSRSQSVRVTVDGVVRTISDVTVINPYESMLPASAAFVWQPTSITDNTGIWNGPVWDTPDAAISLSLHSKLRENRVTLSMAPSAAEHNLTTWMNNNAGRDFPHKEIAPAALYKTDVDTDPDSPTYGQCTGTARVTGGGWCLLREHFQLSVSGLCNGPGTICTITAEHLDAELRFVIDLPVGPLREVVESVCPRVQTVAESGLRVSVLLTNPSNGTNTFLVSHSRPCASDEHFTVSMNGGASTVVPIDLCLEKTPGETVQFFTTVDGDYAACATTLNLTLSAGAGVDSTMPASWNSALVVNSVQVDAVTTTLDDILSRQRETALAIDALYRADLTSYPWQVPNITLDRFNGTAERLRAIAASAQHTADVARAQSNNFSAILTPFNLELAAARAEADARAADTAALTEQLRALNAKAGSDLKDLERVIPYVEQTALQFANSWLKWGLAIINALTKSLTITSEIGSRWDHPVPGAPSHSNGWDSLGSAFVGLGGLGTGAINTLGKGLNAASGLAKDALGLAKDAAGSFGDLITNVLTTIVPVLVIGAVLLLGGAAAIKIVPACCACTSKLAKGKKANTLSSDTLRLYERAQRLLQDRGGGTQLEPLHVFLASVRA